VTVDDYLEIIRRKTASIFEQGARTAAYLARAPGSTVEAMARCGFHVGMTFQVVDDLLDVAGKEARLGKPVGIDLRDGNPSLPMVLALQRDPEVARVFQKESPEPHEVEDTLERIRSSGVLDEVRKVALEFRAKARADMEMLPPSSDREQLLGLIDQLVDRLQ
jgi:octaprenyl-diphosphate synthase